MILSALIQNREFLTTELWRKKEEIKHLKEVIEQTETILRLECKHNWIKDYIDIDEGSQIIIYCDKCKLNLKDK